MSVCLLTNIGAGRTISNDDEEGAVVYGTEKDLSERSRRVIAAVLWLVLGIPLFVGLWFAVGWWILILVAFAAWATWDWVRRGDMYSTVDHSVSHHVRTDEDGTSRFGDGM